MSDLALKKACEMLDTVLDICPRETQKCWIDCEERCHEEINFAECWEIHFKYLAEEGE